MSQSSLNCVGPPADTRRGATCTPRMGLHSSCSKTQLAVKLGPAAWCSKQEGERREGCEGVSVRGGELQASEGVDLRRVYFALTGRPLGDVY